MSTGFGNLVDLSVKARSRERSIPSWSFVAVAGSGARVRCPLDAHTGSMPESVPEETRGACDVFCFLIS